MAGLEMLLGKAAPTFVCLGIAVQTFETTDGSMFLNVCMFLMPSANSNALVYAQSILMPGERAFQTICLLPLKPHIFSPTLASAE